MAFQELPPSERAINMLQKQEPMRIAVFLRKKSPLYSLEYDAVVPRACQTLGIDPVESRAELMTILKWEPMTIFAFNVFYDDYDWATAHHKNTVDLPVIIVDYGSKKSLVKVAIEDHRKEVNRHIERQHESHGWDAKPPYFQDHTIPGVVPTYYFPRLMKTTDPDGTVRRHIKTPPPGSTSAH